MKVSAILWAVFLVSIAAGEALAQASSPRGKSDREVARTLAERGFDLLEQGDAESAIASFRMAEQRVHSPVHQLYIARAEVKLGRLLEAQKSYEGIVAEALPKGSPKPFVNAQAEARAELDALRPRIPSIKITVSGASHDEALVTLDGAPIEPGALGRPVPVNPGKHALRASFDGESVEETVTVAEGHSVDAVDLAIPSSFSVPAVVALSLGGAGLVVGTATGIAYLGETESNPALGVLSLASLITGGVGVVTGSVIIALGSSGSASASSASRPSIRASIAPGSLLVSASF